MRAEVKAHALLECQRWVEGWVVRERLCPFARPAIEAGEVVYRCLDHGEEAPLLSALIEEAENCLQEEQTAILILTDPMWMNFSDYLALLEHAELQLEGHEIEVEGEDEGDRGREPLADHIQLASFHPAYLFEGESASETSHYSNRSPWPILHLLPELLVDRALPEGSDPLKIPKRNIEHLHDLGREEILKKLKALRLS